MMKENNHNTCVVYLLNDIYRHFYLIWIFSSLLENQYETLAKHRCGNLSTPTCDVTMHKMVVPYNSNVCENSLVQWNVWVHRLPRENVITMSLVLVGHNFSSVDILLTFTLCQCNVMTLLNNLSGTGASTTYITFCWKGSSVAAILFQRRSKDRNTIGSCIVAGTSVWYICSVSINCNIRERSMKKLRPISGTIGQHMPRKGYGIIYISKPSS